MIKTPTKFWFVSGHSEGLTPLNAFDLALMDAGIGNVNLIKMSSICPPNCQEVPVQVIPQGSLVPVAYSSITSSRIGEKISSAVAIAFPEDENHCGLIMEYSAASSKANVEAQVRLMAQEGMEKRGKQIREIKSISTEHFVLSIGASFAAVVLFD